MQPRWGQEKSELCHMMCMLCHMVYVLCHMMRVLFIWCTCHVIWFTCHVVWYTCRVIWCTGYVPILLVPHSIIMYSIARTNSFNNYEIHRFEIYLSTMFQQATALTVFMAVSFLGKSIVVAFQSMLP